jgi:hypothetical protein
MGRLPLESAKRALSVKKDVRMSSVAKTEESGFLTIFAYTVNRDLSHSLGSDATLIPWFRGHYYSTVNKAFWYNPL